MKKRRGTSCLLVLALCLALLSACGAQPETTAPAAPAATEAPASEAPASPEAEAPAEEPAEVPEGALPDGVYSAKFDTDSSMFHVNEAYEGRGTLTVENGQMVLHISMPSQKIVNLFPGLAADAAKEGAALLEPTIDTVTYKDGMTEEVFGFDIPVPYLDEEFDCAFLGTKGTWYDHKVSVSDPVEITG